MLRVVPVLVRSFTHARMHKLDPSTSFGTIALFFFSSRIPLVETSFESVVRCLGGKTYQPM